MTIINGKFYQKILLDDLAFKKNNMDVYLKNDIEFSTTGKLKYLCISGSCLGGYIHHKYDYQLLLSYKKNIELSYYIEIPKIGTIISFSHNGIVRNQYEQTNDKIKINNFYIIKEYGITSLGINFIKVQNINNDEIFNIRNFHIGVDVEIYVYMYNFVNKEDIIVNAIENFNKIEANFHLGKCLYSLKDSTGDYNFLDNKIHKIILISYYDFFEKCFSGNFKSDEIEIKFTNINLKNYLIDEYSQEVILIVIYLWYNNNLKYYPSKIHLSKENIIMVHKFLIEFGLKFSMANEGDRKKSIDNINSYMIELIKEITLT